MVDRIIDRIIGYAGKLLIHMVRALLACWQRMLRLGVSVGVLGGVVAVVFGAFITHSIPPAPLTWVMAMCFGFVLGYAAAMTVLADELFLGMVEAIGVLEGDIKAGLRAATVAAEREAGEAGRGIMRLLGHPRAKPAPNALPTRVRQRPQQAPPSSPLLTLSTVERLTPAQSQADETLAAIAATESFLSTAPRLSANARPVRADQLPRIEWASEEAEKRSAQPSPAPVAIPLAEMPPLPVRTLRGPARAEAAMAASPAPAMLVDEPERAAPAQPLVAPDARAATELPTAQEDVAAVEAEQSGDTAPMRAISPDDARGGLVPQAGEVAETPRGDSTIARSPAAAAQPVEAGQPERGIWARIGQALIGNTTRPLQDAERVSDQDDENSAEGEQA